MGFYKPETNEFSFQLANTEVREDFALWDNTSKRFIRQMEGVINIDDLKYMKQELFQQKYPNFRKASQYIREIIVNNGPFSFGFRKTANDQINAEIANVHRLNKNPLDYLFKYRKTGVGLSTTHVVVVMQEVGRANLNTAQNSLPQQQRVTLADAQQNMGLKPIALSHSPIVTITLTSEEQQVVALFNQENEFYSEQQFEQVFYWTMQRHFSKSLSSDRLKLIYKEHYKQR